MFVIEIFVEILKKSNLRKFFLKNYNTKDKRISEYNVMINPTNIQSVPLPNTLYI